MPHLSKRSSKPGTTTQGPRWGARVLAIATLLVAFAAIYVGIKTFQPGHGEGSGAVAVTIPSGSDAGEIGKLLEAKGVVESGRYFSLRATITGRRGNLRSGNYTLLEGMSYDAALDALAEGPKAKVVRTFSVTIPEGRSRREVVPIVKKAGIEGSYLKASESRAAFTRARKLGLPRGARTLEGFLFPATYELVAGADAADLVDKQLEAFGEQLRGLDLRTAKRKNLTRYDIVIIASMVEREAQLDKERPLIAAVIYNRLKQGMPLGIDATIRYYENNWTRPLRVSELERDSAYNTRKRQGLPPTPIGNPGLKSLQAAANPARVSYLYYVVKPNACGEHAFSSTDAKFARDRDRYNAERARRGGKSPTKC